jgi:hypothetical protein
MVKDPRNQFRGSDSANLCSLAEQPDKLGCPTGPIDWVSIPGLFKRFTNTGSELGGGGQGSFLQVRGLYPESIE